MGGYYPPRRSRTSRGSHERMLELILRQGDVSARSRLQGADILSSLVGNLGQQGAAAVEASGKESALKKQAAEMGRRDAAWVQYVESGEWQKSPDQAYVTARRIFGPDGDKQFMALQGVAQLMGEKRNPEADQKALGSIVGAMDAVQDPARARLYPQALALAKKVYPDLQLGDQYDPASWAEISAIGKSLRGEKAAEAFTLGPGEERFGPDGKPIAKVAPKPANPPAVGSFEDYVLRKFGEKPAPEQIEAARKAYNQADDRPPDPVARELAALRLSEAKDKAAGAQSEGDRVADAWAAGMSFPSTQDATSAALESFARRGMPVPRKLGVGMQQEAVRTAETLATIEEVRDLYAKVKDRIGPVSYPLNELNQRLPWTDSDPDFVAFNTLLRSMGNLEIKRITGAQMSEKEADRLLKGMATGTLKPGDFEAALGIMESNARRNRDILLYGKVQPKEGAGLGRFERTGDRPKPSGSRYERVD